MVLFDHESNDILVKSLKLRSAQELGRAYKVLHAHLCDRGLRPLFQILDNECPANLKKFMHQKGVDFKLVPPHLHHTNSSERAIHNYMDHLVTDLSIYDPIFPLHLLDRLLHQAPLTLNLLPPSWIKPRLSAKDQLNGDFDFNQTPLTPPGTKVLV